MVNQFGVPIIFYFGVLFVPIVLSLLVLTFSTACEGATSASRSVWDVFGL